MHIGLLSLIYKSFFQPQVFGELKNEKRWWKGFLALFLTMWLTSLIVFLVERPIMAERVNTFIDWFSGELSSVEFVDGKFNFTSKKTFPIISENNGIKVIIHNDETEFSETDFTSENVIIFLSQKEGLLGTKYDQENSIKQLYLDGQIGNKEFSLAEFFKDININKFDIQSLTKMTTLIIFITFSYIFIYNLLAASFIILILIVMNKLLRSPLFLNFTFGQLFGFYCFVGILPAIFAIIYSSPMIEFSSFFTLFISIFMAQFFFRVIRFIIPTNFLNKNNP